MAAAIPIALMIGGAVVKNQAEKQQADEQRSQLNDALTRTADTQKKSNVLVQQQADNLSPIARAAAMTQQTGANLDQSKSDLTSAGAADGQGNAIINTAGDNGAVSKDFLTAKADRALEEGTRLSSIAQQLAKVRAPGQVQEQEGQQRANLTEALADMWGTTQHLNDANSLTAQNTPLPSYALAGDLAQAAGSVYGGKAGGTGLGTSRMLPKNAKGGTIWGGGDTSMGGYA
jgi:hypothetical protein